ncbi:MAG TPA: class I SAM-dependent methyltransferase [Chryseosolibacter sp.]|nr:class I SAM-dependent methyltransferase [Chryseosolibacter sp.]
MRVFMAAVFFLLHGSSIAQDPWKNIYSEHAWEARDQWQKPDELIRMLNISSGSEVADVGCHEGYMTFKLAKQVGGKGTVYAVDIEESKLEKVRKRAEESKLLQIKVINGDDNNPGLPPNALDAVIILDTYHEMDDHDEVLQHLKSSLRAGGRLVICEPIADSRRNLTRVEQERKHELDIQYALSDLKKAGFTIYYQKDNFIDRTKEKGDKMWVLVALKE